MERFTKALVILVMMMRVFCSPQVHLTAVVDNSPAYGQNTMVAGNFMGTGGTRAETFGNIICVSEKSLYFR